MKVYTCIDVMCEVTLYEYCVIKMFQYLGISRILINCL